MYRYWRQSPNFVKIPPRILCRQTTFHNLNERIRFGQSHSSRFTTCGHSVERSWEAGEMFETTPYWAFTSLLPRGGQPLKCGTEVKYVWTVITATSTSPPRVHRHDPYWRLKNGPRLFNGASTKAALGAMPIERNQNCLGGYQNIAKEGACILWAL